MCAEPIADEHQHVVDVQSRELMCTCRGCYLLFTAEQADLRYRAVPDRYLSFPDFALDRSRLGRPADPGRAGVLLPQLRAGPGRRVLPGPAGATESELRLAAWDASRWRPTPSSAALSATSRRCWSAAPGRDTRRSCFLVPIDACYELVGRLRTVWRGFDGGQEARAAIDGLLRHRRRARKPAAVTTGGGRPMT